MKPSTMNRKINYKVKIGDVFIDFRISDRDGSYPDEKIFRYMKASLMRSGINYWDLMKENLKLDVKKCPFCNSDTKYKVLYRVDKKNKILEITGADHILNDGMINYHCKGGKKKCPGSVLNPNSIDYISIAFMVTKDEARKYILDRNRSPFYEKNHSSYEDYKAYQARNLDWYISKYGELEGKKRYDEFRNKVSVGNSKESIIEKHGVNLYNDIIRRKKVCTIEHFISKYGEELGKSKFEEFKKSLGRTKEQFIEKFGNDAWNQRYESIQYKKSLDFYVKKLGEKEGRKAFLDLRKSYSFNKDQYIEKYGEDKWINRYSNLNCSFYSKEGSVFINKLLDEIEKIGLPIVGIKKESDEFFLWDPEYKRIYFYDLYFECFSKKIIVEYDNNFWHPRNENDITAWDKLKLDHKFNKSEKIEYDERKRMFAKYKGYQIINVSYNGRSNPLRKKNSELWDTLLMEVLDNIKNILIC